MNETVSSGGPEYDNITYGHETFGKYEFLQLKPWIAIPSIVVLAIVTLGGTFGNILTILAVAFNRKIRHVEKAFVVNLAFSDLYVTAVADPMSILGKYHTVSQSRVLASDESIRTPLLNEASFG